MTSTFGYDKLHPPKTAKMEDGRPAPLAFGSDDRLVRIFNLLPFSGNQIFSNNSTALSQKVEEMAQKVDFIPEDSPKTQNGCNWIRAVIMLSKRPLKSDK